ncbi:MAG: LOG family protein [Proteobacteria bacterium]|nr:LOG family protein [Pseudomonadota bacterium]MBU4294717.1 LOG family protein [Pseudomonadota bacterium]MCG2746299.1 LOG family protein [Desulfobulbaceae bacterium]
MKRPPLLTEDGYLLVDQKTEPTIDEELGVPKLAGVMRLEETSDTLRGVIGDFAAAGILRQHCCLIGRSGHSQIGLDVDFGEGLPEIDTRRKRIDLPVQLTSLNPNIPDTLFAEIKAMVDGNRRLTIGRLFVPMAPPLSREAIEEAVADNHILLTPKSKIDGDGVVTIPLDNIRYLLSNTLLTAGQNGQIVLYESKQGLGLIQYYSHSGLPTFFEPGDFLCGAMRISLGPYSALIERELNEAGVFHLAARLLDAVRTSGINIPRQVELYNGSDRAVATHDLQVRLRLFPADLATARVATRLLSGSRAQKIMQDGVDFADATNIFDINVCDALFDNLSSVPTERGNYGRILTRSKCIDIQRELLENEWHEIAQNRIVYEAVRGTITSGVHRSEQITQELRGFVESLDLVGGAQNLRKVFVSHEFPLTDTLRVLKRNNVGVFIGRSIRPSETQDNGIHEQPQAARHNIYFGQTTFETFCDLSSREMARFYMVVGEGGERHVREFHRGFWMTREGKEKIGDVHTVIAMFGSHVEGTDEVLTEQIHQFFARLTEVPEIGGCFAVCHGSGPGVMRIADDAAADQGILRIGIGIDSEKIGQRANLRPPVLLNFNNSARHVRQNILDRTSLFKIYNIGGTGTFEELLIAITNLKLFESLPAPHIFVDPFGLGENGAHLWESTLAQLKTTSSLKTIGSHIVRLAPAWVPNFCHVVRDYDAVLEIIADFARDPATYWEKAGIADHDLQHAFDNAERAGVIIPPYLRDAMQSVRSRCE